MLQSLRTLGCLEVVKIQRLVIPADQGQGIDQMDVPDDGLVAVFLQRDMNQQTEEQRGVVLP